GCSRVHSSLPCEVDGGGEVVAAAFAVEGVVLVELVAEGGDFGAFGVAGAGGAGRAVGGAAAGGGEVARDVAGGGPGHVARPMRTPAWMGRRARAVAAMWVPLVSAATSRASASTCASSTGGRALMCS